jgi:hypothetical protein
LTLGLPRGACLAWCADNREGIAALQIRPSLSLPLQIGPAHVISLASFYEGGFGPTSAMSIWLKADLKAIDRSVTPWVSGGDWRVLGRCLERLRGDGVMAVDVSYDALAGRAR